jgi:geranylgeranyl reductase family protein
MYDVIVIGGGPSGASAARLAGKLGLKTLLLEKKVFPRYKPCGGALSEQAMSYLDFTIPQELIEKEIYGARVHFKGNAIERFKDYRIAVLVTRSKFDNYLLDKSIETGIDVHTGEKAIDFQDDNNSITVHTQKNKYPAKFLIIAEGAHGRLKYRIRRRDNKTEYGICAVTDIPKSNEKIDLYIYNSIELFFGITRMGYGWIFPHDGYYSVGIGGLAKYFKQPKIILDPFLKSNGYSGEYKIHHHLIPVGGIRRRVFSKRVFLIGDAAGFIDSFYGEGLAYAIKSGQIAVNTIYNILSVRSNLDQARTYMEICNSEFGDTLYYSLMLTKIMNAFPNLFLRILSKDIEALDKFLEVPGMRRSYKSYLSWLILNIPRNLWKLAI